MDLIAIEADKIVPRAGQSREEQYREGYKAILPYKPDPVLTENTIIASQTFPVKLFKLNFHQTHSTFSH